MADEPDVGRWLNEDEMSAWLPLMQVLLRLPQALDRQLRQTAGLNHAHYMILAILSAREAPLPMTELAESASVSQSRLSHAVAGLEERGWVRRVPCPTDRRIQFAELTAAGAGLLEAAAPGHVAEVRRLVFDRLTPTDISDLRRIATRVLAALDD